MASGAIAFANEANDNIVTASSTEAGFGGPVTVTLDVDVAAQSVAGVAIEGDAETPEKGGKAIEAMQQAMLEIGSIEVDGVGGASVTSEAIQGAARRAFDAAVSGEAPSFQQAALMAPGTYTASAKSGYWEIVDLPVTITVNENAILKIEVPSERLDHGETEVIHDSVKELWFPPRSREPVHRR